MGIKAEDCFIAAICCNCHAEIDQGKTYTKDVRKAVWDKAHKRTMAHEMIHMSFYKRKGHKWAQHGKEFRTRCLMVGKELGFDPLEL